MTRFDKISWQQICILYTVHGWNNWVEMCVVGDMSNIHDEKRKCFPDYLAPVINWKLQKNQRLAKFFYCETGTRKLLKLKYSDNLAWVNLSKLVAWLERRLRVASHHDSYPMTAAPHQATRTPAAAGMSEARYRATAPGQAARWQRRSTKGPPLKGVDPLGKFNFKVQSYKTP